MLLNCFLETKNILVRTPERAFGKAILVWKTNNFMVHV